MLAALTAPARAVPERPPNFVVIIADDQHWSDTSVRMDPRRKRSHNPRHRTPNLEALARQGMRFSSAYATPLCRPTQLALQTGKSPARLQITTNSANGLLWLVPEGSFPADGLSSPLPRLNPWVHALRPQIAEDLGDPRVRPEQSIARRLLESAPAYRTGHFGKFAGILRGWGYFDEGIARSSRPPEVDPKGMFTFSDGANRFMGEAVAAGRPFFVMITHNAPKLPVEALPATEAWYRRAQIDWPGDRVQPGVTYESFAAMTEDLDTSLGSILHRIQELGIEESTYVIYSSDNGRSGISSATQAPLRRGKGFLYEGGIRVPLIIRGPGIAAGSVSRVPVTLTDLFPTISELGGSRYPLPPEIDGASLAPLLMNGGRLPPGIESLRRPYGEHGELYFLHILPNRHSAAVIAGDWKLLRFFAAGGSDRLELYNLLQDIGETTDLAQRRPHKTAELRARLDRWLAGVDASLPYVASAPTELVWHADRPGEPEDVELSLLRASLGTDRPGSDLNADGIVDEVDLGLLLARLPRSWRSTVDVDYKDRELWSPAAAGAPAYVALGDHRPALPAHAFRFDGGQGMERMLFHVSDPLFPDPLGQDHSVSFELWLRFASLAGPQVLFETGDARRGLSVTLGDDDGDGRADDLRLRARGTGGAAITVTARLPAAAVPSPKFIHLVAVLDDGDDDRHAAIYVDGELRGRVAGEPGVAGRIDWDGEYRAIFEAGLGRSAGELGGGDGELPFAGGGFVGELAYFAFANRALAADEVERRYAAGG